MPSRQSGRRVDSQTQWHTSRINVEYAGRNRHGESNLHLFRRGDVDQEWQGQRHLDEPEQTARHHGQSNVVSGKKRFSAEDFEARHRCAARLACCKDMTRSSKEVLEFLVAEFKIEVKMLLLLRRLRKRRRNIR